MWAKSESNTRFAEIDAPEWYDYDEKAQASVSVTEVNFTIQAAR